MNSFVVPSVIASDGKDALEIIERLLPFTRYFQIDVMDGEFVRNKSFFGFNFDKLPKRHGRIWKRKIGYEAHLMVESPKPWLVKNLKYFDCVILHYESDVHLHEMIKLVKSNGKKIGVAINPSTDAEALSQYIHLIDKVLVMTVSPGKYGSKFIPGMIEKIRHVREMSSKIDIEVDGGMNPENISLCKQAGANQFVAGSYLKNSKDLKSSWNILQREIKK